MYKTQNTLSEERKDGEVGGRGHSRMFLMGWQRGGQDPVGGAGGDGYGKCHLPQDKWDVCVCVCVCVCLFNFL